MIRSGIQLRAVIVLLSVLAIMCGLTAGVSVTANAAPLRAAEPRVAVIKTDGVGSQVQAGLIPDLTVGPGGRVWLVAKKPHSSAYELQAVSPVTNAISSYSLADKSPGRLTYNGEITAGKSGTLWLSATKRSGAGVVIRYTPATRKLAEFGTPAGCNGKDIYTEVSLYTASDGYVWLRCVSGSDNSVVERIASSGKSSRIRVPGATPEISELVPGPKGSMYAVATGEGVTRLSPSGSSAYLIDSNTENVLDISGNGTGRIVTLNEYFVAGNDEIVFYTLGPGRAEKRLAKAHQYEGYNAYMALQPTMAANGTDWQLVNKSVLEPSGGQYYLEVSPKGKTTVFKLAIPAKSAVKLGLSPVGPPVITSNGAIWEEESTYPGTGQLVRFTP